MNTQFDELIARHLKGILQEDEKKQLAMMLRIPENQLYLASKMDEQFFDQLIEEAGDKEIGNQILHGIHQKLEEAKEQTIQQPAPVVEMPWYRRRGARLIGIAASIILVIGLGISLFTNNKSDEPSIAVQNNTLHTDSTVAMVRHEANTTGKEKRLQLFDGSVIILADKSEITYFEPFISKREVTLNGKAYFKVARDKTKPFTVISGDISTTALGTEFTVTTFGNSNQIIVRLYEGKVIIKAVDKTNKELKKDVFLTPGQAFVYGSHTTSATVSTFKLDNAAAPEVILNEELFRDNPSIPENAEGSWYMFNNHSLGQVFDQLALIYNVKIVYDKNDVQNIYFTRKYSSSSSIEDILKEITTLNNLSVTKKDNVFIISK